MGGGGEQGGGEHGHNLHPVQEEKLQNMKKKTLEDLKNTFLSIGLYKK